MSSIAQALTDKSFLEAHPDDQRAYIAEKDPAFAKASKEDQDAYYNARVLPAVKQHSLQLNAPGVTTKFEQEPRELREAAVGRTPNRLERVGSEIAGGLASSISGAPETTTPLRDLYREMEREGGEAQLHPVRTMLHGPGFNPFYGAEQLYDIGKGVVHGVGEIGRGIGEEVGLIHPDEKEGGPTGLERSAHGVGTSTGKIAQLIGAKEAPEFGESGRLSNLTSRAVRTEGGAGDVRPIIRLAAPERAKVLEQVVPRVKQGGTGAPLPSSEEFYENAGAERAKDYEARQKQEKEARAEAERADREREEGHREFANRVRTIEDARQKEITDQARLRQIGEQEEEAGHKEFANRLSETEQERQTELANEGRLRRIGEENNPEAQERLQPVGAGEESTGKARSPRGYFNPGRPAETVNLNDLANRLSNVRPLEPDVPLREQLTSKPAAAIEPAKIDPIKAKYPDSQVRQMVRANGERIYEAAKGDPALVKSIHDLTRVDLRQALINAGEDVGQTTVSNSKFAGEGSISREQAFNRLLDLGKSPKEIVDLAKPKEVFRAHDEGNPKMDLERSHAHATSSADEAQRYAESRNGGENQQVSKTDLSGLKEGKDYTRFKGPNGQDWIRFHRQVEWEPVR